MASDRHQNIAEYIRANHELPVARLEEAFPGMDTWAIRSIRREVLRELGPSTELPRTLHEASALPGLTAAARNAVRLGFFRPVDITITERRPVKPRFKKAGYSYLVWSDAHAEIEDPHALDVTTQIGQAVGVDEVVFAGDWFDVHALSSYTPGADRPARWVNERAQALPVVGSCRAAFPKQKAWWINGNHDVRPLKYIDRVAPELQGMFTLPELLGIEGLDFSYPDNNRLVIADKLMIIHGERVRGESGASVRAEVRDHGLSVIMGHVHRRGIIEAGHGRTIWIDSDRPTLVGDAALHLSETALDGYRAEGRFSAIITNNLATTTQELREQLRPILKEVIL